MDFEPDTLKNGSEAAESGGLVEQVTGFAILAAVAAKVLGPVAGGKHVSRQSSNSRRRKRTAEGSGRVQACHRREVFYVTSLDGRVAQLYPFEEWERIEQKLAALSTFNPTKKKFLSRVNYYGQVVEMDGQGRLLMPQLLRESAQIKGEVAVMGNLTYLEVRNMEALQHEIEEEKFTAEDEKTLDELGI